MPRLSKIGAAALAAFGWSSGSAGVTASYLVVAGGGGAAGTGGGSAGGSGGGGAGGLLTGTVSLNPTLSYTVTVGAGGAAGAAVSNGNNGANSVFYSITSTGGGGGGNGGSGAGGNGGSGGGGNGNNGGPTIAPGGTGVSGQGFNGGAGASNEDEGGGGGGASAVGTAGVGGTSRGNGGAGTASSISGSSVTYAGGGGGGGNNVPVGGTGGAGGGGSSPGSQGPGGAGTANTGGGGGGGYATSANQAGGQGGSGIVIISYAGAQQFGGGVVTSSGGNTIHTFTTSGTLSPITPLTASYLIVAGGGSGGYDTAGNAGGGGAGGLLTGTGLTLDANSIYTVTVGAGGTAPTAANSVGNDGSNSAFSLVATTAVGGGGGGTYSNFNGRSGGSGGGGGQTSGAGGAGTSGQGNAGGTNSSIAGSGGGGAGAVGVSSSTALGGNGGAGSASSISGTSSNYAGGGGGSNHGSAGSQGGLGGTGGGGNGHYGATAGQAGTANTGGGGGGGGETRAAGNGGSGIVIISYAGATQQMAGGTVTIVGGNVIHTFNSSGYLTPLTLLTRSLRFRSSASAYLNRTFGTATSRRIFTLSAWVKRGALGTTSTILSNEGYREAIGFFGNSSGAGDSLSFRDTTGGAYEVVTTAVFRDPSAWYHIVVAFDTTQATASNRVKMYVNGVQQTSFAVANYPGQNSDLYINSADVHYIGRRSTIWYYDGYMTEINFIDGQALTPSSFGSFNAYGSWSPVRYGGSYGTNGFYLPFTNNASTTTLGYDFSPNGNNWTTNNISLTAGSTYDSMTDVPTLTSATAANYAVLNPLDKGTNATSTDGNLNFSMGGGNNYEGIRATIGISSSGKWYWEATYSGLGYISALGIATASVGINGTTATSTRTLGTGSWFNTFNGGVVQYNTDVNATSGINWSGASQPSSNDVYMVALDMDSGKMWIGKNGTWFNSSGTANPVTGTDPRWSSLTGFTWFPYSTEGGGGITKSFNFGQRPFSYTPPSGFVGLNTFNL